MSKKIRMLSLLLAALMLLSCLVACGDQTDEPGKESGTSAEADFELMDFIFTEDGSISFARAEYFADEPECDILPSVFIGGAYVKVENG